MAIYLLGSLGLPGSGKSTFLERFATEQHFFYWQNDEARRRIFSRARHDPTEHEMLGRASRYVFEQLLDLGVSCVYDVNLNRRRHRTALSQLAKSHDAQFILLRFQVPVDIAKSRVAQRSKQAEGEQKQYFQTFRPDVVEFMARQMEPLAPEEPVIKIDGTAPFEQQIMALASLQL